MTSANRFDAFAAAARAAPAAVAVVLGSGMGPVACRVAPILSVPFADVPGLPPAAVAGHKGCLTLGTWAGRRVLVFEGRVHRYEGHSWDDVVAPVRAAHALGARVLLLTNAAGGIRDDLGPGALMALRDHVEWTRPYCWRTPGEPLGPPRPSPYSARLRELLRKAAEARGIDLREGVYATLTGPCYETPAEIRALRAWGADAVGMSTAREARTAFDVGMECAAISCVTNWAAGLGGGPLSHEDVLATAGARSERLASLIEEFIGYPE